MQLNEQRAIYTLKSRKAFNTVRTCRIIDLTIGIPLTLLAIGQGVGALAKLVTGDLSSMPFEAVKVGLIIGFCGLVTLWAGQAMLFSSVNLSRHWLSSGGDLLFHRWRREKIVAIDIRQHNLGRKARTVPFVVLRDGESNPSWHLQVDYPASARLPSLPASLSRPLLMNCAVPLGSVAATFTLAWPSDKLIAPGQCRLGVAAKHKRNAPRHRQYRRSVPTVRDLPSVKVNGIELAYTVAGEVGLPPVVLLHALAEDSSGWSVVVEALVPRYRVYAVDLRGHGGSSRPGDYSLELMRSDVLGFLRALNLEGVSLIGHSLGGAVAYLVAEAEPERVRHLVLEEPPPPLPATPPRAVPTKPSVPLPFDWRVLDAVVRQRNHPDPAWWEDLNLICAHTLVIAGGTGSHLPQDQVVALAGRIPDAVLVTINAGHNVHTRRPDAFLAELLPFLAR